jgi:hypothetical protein
MGQTKITDTSHEDINAFLKSILFPRTSLTRAHWQGNLNEAMEA